MGDPGTVVGVIGLVITAIGLVAVGWAISRRALVTILERELDAVRARADRLHTENEELVRSNIDLAKVNSDLTVKTDLTPVMERMASQFEATSVALERITDALSAVERRLNGHT